MDKLRNDILQTLKNQEDITKQMMKLVLSSEKEENEENEELDELDLLEKEFEKDEKPIKRNNIKVVS